jgi:tetratricopeptide (TPR) repeat protein/uncharacterized membrane protein YtjA (UPF0391 family)
MREKILSWSARILLGFYVLTLIAGWLGLGSVNVGPVGLDKVLLLILLGLLSWMRDTGVALLDQLTQRIGEASTLKSHMEALVRGVEELAHQVEDVRKKIAEGDLLLPAKLALYRGAYDEAKAFLEDVLERSPSNEEANWLYGLVLFRTRRPWEALDYLRKAVRPNDSKRLSTLAQCEEEIGRYSDAEQHAEQAVRVADSDREQVIALLGRIQSRLDVDRARQTLKDGLKSYPRASAIRYALIDLELEVGNIDEAMRIAEQGYQLNERDAGCLVRKAAAVLKRGQPGDASEALRCLEEAKKINRRDVYIYKLWGEILFERAQRATDPNERRRHLEEAVNTYAQGIPLFRGWAKAALLAAQSRALLLLGRLAEAEDAADAAVKEASSHVSNYIALALARLARERYLLSVVAARDGRNYGGRAGRIQLLGAEIMARFMAGEDAKELEDLAKSLADEWEAFSEEFQLQDTWLAVRDTLGGKVASREQSSQQQLFSDTFNLLAGRLGVEEYRRKWVPPRT